MNKAYLLRCWSGNENYNGDFDMAIVRVDDKLREKAWKLRKLREEFVKKLDPEGWSRGMLSISFEMSFFSNEPVFLAENEPYESFYGRDSQELQLSEEELRALEKKALHEEGTRIRVDREGMYWTTYPKHADVVVTTASLSWKALGIG